jgi:ferrous iron transport protein B
MINEVATGITVLKPHRLQNEPPALKQALSALVEELEAVFPDLPNARWVALRLLDGDERIVEAVRKGELGELSSGQAERARPQLAAGVGGTQ